MWQCSKPLEGKCQTKIALKKKLRQQEQWEGLAKIHFSIFCIPLCYLMQKKITITGLTNLFGVLCGYETLSLSIKKQHRLIARQKNVDSNIQTLDGESNRRI